MSDFIRLSRISAFHRSCLSDFRCSRRVSSFVRSCLLDFGCYSYWTSEVVYLSMSADNHCSVRDLSNDSPFCEEDASIQPFCQGRTVTAEMLSSLHIFRQKFRLLVIRLLRRSRRPRISTRFDHSSTLDDSLRCTKTVTYLISLMRPMFKDTIPLFVGDGRFGCCSLFIGPHLFGSASFN